MARFVVEERLLRMTPSMSEIGGFPQEMNRKSNKTWKNRKKPIKTEEISLTKSSERMKVNCGTVLRTRMNTDDYGLSER
jgi:hypothetical protein